MKLCPICEKQMPYHDSICQQCTKKQKEQTNQSHYIGLDELQATFTCPVCNGMFTTDFINVGINNNNSNMRISGIEIECPGCNTEFTVE